MVVLLRGSRCGSVLLDGDLADAGVEVEGRWSGRSGSVDPVIVRVRDWSKPLSVRRRRCLMSPAKCMSASTTALTPRRQGHVDLAGVEVEVDLAAVERRDVTDAGAGRG